MPVDRPTFDHYLSGHYTRIGDQGRFRERRKRQMLATYRHLLPVRRDAEMLEIGPGHGQWLEALHRDAGYTRTIAVDLSAEVAEFCNRSLPGSTEVVGDTTAWLLANAGRFERIFAFHVLEHVPGPDLVPLLEAARDALRPGGWLVVEVPNMANIITGNYLRHADRTHQTGFAELSLRQALEDAGFADARAFEERLVVSVPQDVVYLFLRSVTRALQWAAYKSCRVPVPAVLTPALCMSARRTT